MSKLDNRPENRLERRKQDTRRRLLEAAAFLVERMGYEKLTIKAITDLADLGYGTFYVHFENKEAILWEVFFLWSEQYLDALDAELSIYPSPLKEYRGWLAFFEVVAQNRASYAAMFGLEGNPILRARFQEYNIARITENLKAKVYEPAPMYAALPLDYMARFVAGTQLQLADWLLTADCPYNAKEMATLLFRTVYHQAPPDIS
jgi:AcrR family transcriptional regulator